MSTAGLKRGWEQIEAGARNLSKREDQEYLEEGSLGEM